MQSRKWLTKFCLRSAVKVGSGSVTTVHEMIKTEFDILSEGPNCVRAFTRTSNSSYRFMF